MDFPWLCWITRGLAAANYKGCVSSASHGTQPWHIMVPRTPRWRMAPQEKPSGSAWEWASSEKNWMTYAERIRKIGRIWENDQFSIKEAEKMLNLCLIGRPALKSGEFYLWKIADCNSCWHCLVLPLGFERSWFELQWMFKSVERVGQWDIGFFTPSHASPVRWNYASPVAVAMSLKQHGSI